MEHMRNLSSYAHQAKAIELLNPFSFAIKNWHPSKYSSAVAKKEREGKENNACYRGHFALVASFCLHFMLKQAA